jgi:transcriptional regulator with XRE-family HTH domain
VDGWALRRHRRKAGLTAAQVARVTGTSESNIAAYERGDKVPASVTLQRIVDAIEAGSDSAIYVNGVVTTPQAAAAIRFGLRRDWNAKQLLRVVREQRSQAKLVSHPIDQRVFFARPSTTGDRRWDALLAGSTEEMAIRRHLPIPEWTTGVRLEGTWYVDDDPGWNDFLLAHSPEPFRSRGVMIDPSALLDDGE